MSTAIKVDMSSFTKAMQQFQRDSKKTSMQVLVSQAQKLISSKFAASDDKGGKGGLYQEARRERFATIAEIKGLPERLGYRIKRDPGVTVPQEIKRRLKHAGYVQSTGWLNRVYALRGKGSGRQPTVRLVGKPRGRVVIKEGTNPSIEITNETPGAADFAAKTGYFSRAVQNRERDMANYLHDKMIRAAKKAGFHAA